MSKKHRALTISLLAFALGGCAETNYRLTELYGYNCRPVMIHAHGACVASR